MSWTTGNSSSNCELLLSSAIFDFKKADNEIILLTSPLSFHVENAPNNLRLDLTDLQACREGTKKEAISMKHS
jgi:hypothetical protein